MKPALNIVAALLIMIGGVWFFQGINFLLGSFMSGQPRWAIAGAVVAVLGIILAALNNRPQTGRG